MQCTLASVGNRSALGVTPSESSDPPVLTLKPCAPNLKPTGPYGKSNQAPNTTVVFHKEASYPRGTATPHTQGTETCTSSPPSPTQHNMSHVMARTPLLASASLPVLPIADHS